MNSHNPVGNGLKMLALILSILVLILAGALWFDYLGLLEVKSFFSPVLSVVGVTPPQKATDPGAVDLLDSERQRKVWQAIEEERAVLARREENLGAKETEITQKAESLDEKEKSLEEREKAFNERLKQYDNKNANLRDVAGKLMNMPPADAVSRLLGMEDQYVIDILRMVDTLAEEAGTQSSTAYWLSQMPGERASKLSTLMLKTPSRNE